MKSSIQKHVAAITDFLLKNTNIKKSLNLVGGGDKSVAI